MAGNRVGRVEHRWASTQNNCDRPRRMSRAPADDHPDILINHPVQFTCSSSACNTSRSDPCVPSDAAQRHSGRGSQVLHSAQAFVATTFVSLSTSVEAHRLACFSSQIGLSAVSQACIVPRPGARLEMAKYTASVRYHQVHLARIQEPNSFAIHALKLQRGWSLGSVNQCVWKSFGPVWHQTLQTTHGCKILHAQQQQPALYLREHRQRSC